MENEINPVQHGNSIEINPVMQGFLIETAKWGKFLAIVGFVMLGLLVLFAVIAMAGMSFLSSMSGAGVPMALFGLIYLVIAALYFFPVFYLFKFSVQLRKGLESVNQSLVTDGFENLKSLFKFMGILMIVVLSLYAIILLIAIPSALMLGR
jgi:uncharacterized membrane protein